MSIQLTTVFADPTQVTDPIAYAAEARAGPARRPATCCARGCRDTKLRVRVPRPPASTTTGRGRCKKLDLVGVGFVPGVGAPLPGGPARGPVIGLVGSDDTGLGGLEYRYDADAHRQGRARSSSSATRRATTSPDRDAPGRGPSAATDLVLTLDESLQWNTEQALVDEVTRRGAKGGMAVIVDVKTGDMLALASVDGATRHRAARVRRARASQPPADRRCTSRARPTRSSRSSTAIQDGLVGPTPMIDVPSAAARRRRDLHRRRRRTATCEMSVADILRAVVEHRHDQDRAAPARRTGSADACAAFGFGSPTRSTSPARRRACCSTPTKYYDTGLASTAIGYGVAVTGMQMLDVYATIANGGVTRPPRLLDATIDAHGQAARRAARRRGTGWSRRRPPTR